MGRHAKKKFELCIGYKGINIKCLKTTKYLKQMMKIYTTEYWIHKKADIRQRNGSTLESKQIKQENDFRELITSTSKVWLLWLW